MKTQGWIFRTPMPQECPKCRQVKHYFLVGGNYTTNYEIVSCSDCYWQECVNAQKKHEGHEKS